MIELTSISGKTFYVNCDLIYKMEELADTVVTMTDGKTLRVKNRTDDILEKIVEYRRRINNALPEVER